LHNLVHSQTDRHWQLNDLQLLADIIDRTFSS